ncbi:MAG: hydrogenase maturation protease [Myxococcota bacterium]
MRARVIALGQRAAGDDGVGLSVLEWLRAYGVPAQMELRQAAEASALLELLQTPSPTVVVDAVLATPAGRVLVLTPDELDARGLLAASSHGLGVGQVVQLARTLHAEAVSPHITMVAVSIERPERYGLGLSPQVAAAVPQAGARVMALAGVECDA